MSFCIFVPYLYWYTKSKNFSGQQTYCGSLVDKTTDTSLEKIFLNKILNAQAINVYGRLVYNPVKESYNLQDGLFSIPVDLSECQELNYFRDNNPLVIINGTVNYNNEKPYIFVHGLKESIPGWLQVIYNAAPLTSTYITFSLLFGIISFFRWLLPKIGLGKEKKKEKNITLINNRRAGSLILLGLFTPLTFLINPYLGLGIYLAGLLAWAKPALQSQKKIVAFIGLCFCTLGIISMTIYTFSIDAFRVPHGINFFDGIIKNESKTATGTEPLVLTAYTNTKNGFSFHPPKNWEKNESGKENMVVQFTAPGDLGTAEGKPIHAKMGVMIITLPQNVSLDDVFNALMKEAKNTKDFNLIKDNTPLFVGGQLESRMLESTQTEKGYNGHLLMALIPKGNKLYMIGAQAPSKDWETFQALFRDSIRTFEIQ